MISLFRFISVFFVSILFIGCEIFKPKDTDGLRNIIPTAERDRAPRNPRDVSTVADAVPKHERRTAAGNKSPYKVKGVVYRVMDDPSGYIEQGLASWYGEKFQGNHTSNGEIYDMYQMTAAHKTLPIPSYVRVTNLENGKSLIARVNDRGPFASGRIIDLSYAGAYKLDYLKAGTVKVVVEYLDPNDFAADAKQTPPGGAKAENAAASGFTPTSTSASKPKAFLQAGAFSSDAAASGLQRRLSARSSWPVAVEKGVLASGSAIYRVIIGPLPDEASVQQQEQALIDDGLSKPLRVVR